MVSKSIPIRFDQASIDEIDSISAMFGLTRSALIKLSVRLQVRSLRAGHTDLQSILQGMRIDRGAGSTTKGVVR